MHENSELSVSFLTLSIGLRLSGVAAIQMFVYFFFTVLKSETSQIKMLGSSVLLPRWYLLLTLLERKKIMPSPGRRTGEREFPLDLPFYSSSNPS